MPRSLSGVREGEFDTIEVTEKMTAQDVETQGKITAQDLETQGSFSHTGTTAPLFSTLKVGQNPTEPAGSVVLRVDGDISCANFVTTGIEHTLTFTLADGVTTKTYDGSTDVTLTATEMTPTTTPSTLTLKHGSSTVGTYSTSNQTLTIPRPVTATLTHSTPQTIAIDDAPVLLMSGYGLTLSNLASNTKVKVDVQAWISNSTSTLEEIFLALTTSKTSHASNYVRELFWEADPSEQGLATYSKVLTLSGTVNIGLALDSKDNAFSGLEVRLGGIYPDVLMTATIVDDTSTTYSSGG